ncbi:helix-turn-helix transcriptional regulator [Paenibacillus sp. SYP-B4298]|uniref:helix-turn-helix transcriptional regulator n=1 Tax=Paenibacillus sp. SYP-B4298 TaxID=2996034 RepID=UPI0022DD1834|nr:helix-turn-helix transcriptional regulator [Paenibacillus sp. SYP-B4298]
MVINIIRELRKERNITQEELAIALQVTRQTIIAIEGYKYNPSLELGLKIATFFGKPVEHIFSIQE